MNFDWTFSLASPLEITAAANKPLPSYATDTQRNTPAREWNGFASYPDAVKLAETGWTDAPNLSDLAEQIAPTETRTVHEMRHAVTGAFVDVSRFIEGHPEDMMEFAEEPAPRSIRLAVSLSKNSETTAREMELAGAVALAVIDALARSGFAVDLSAYNVIESYIQKGKKTFSTGRKALTLFPIARAGEPVDANQLAFWLCHPAALRQLVLGFWDTCPKDFHTATKQNDRKGIPREATAAEIGVDYVLSCSPKTEAIARAEYHRIISEIQATL